ncbi:hypothetical protein ACIBG4_06590 [Nonomuraea sp. NPDC050383]|uniref:hypothetical protein n=1 Tax=Nonomuraea sp. NPDC050383 TaxID=3364362 RepID=UPI00379A7753
MLLVGTALLAVRGELFPAPVHQVPSAALDDVRRIGKVQAEGSDELGHDGQSDIAYTFIIDVRSARPQGAAGKATSLLRGQGWEVIGQGRLGVAMKSARWRAVLSVDRFDRAALQYEPDLLKVLQEKSVSDESLVIIRVDAYRDE